MNRLSRIRFCRSASAALPPEHHRAFEAKFGIGIVETMGLTETVAPAFSNPIEPQLRKIGSVGRAVGLRGARGRRRRRTASRWNCRRDRDSRAAGHAGLLQKCGSDCSRILSATWLRSGDLGYRDADGFFFVTGRIKELIIKGGENIAPREIDEALLRHPAVLDAAAVGIPDRHYGQDIMACVVVRDGQHCSEEELARFLQSRARAIQDAEDDPLRRRSAAWPIGQGAAPQLAHLEE